MPKAPPKKKLTTGKLLKQASVSKGKIVSRTCVSRIFTDLHSSTIDSALTHDKDFLVTFDPPNAVLEQITLAVTKFAKDLVIQSIADKKKLNKKILEGYQLPSKTNQQGRHQSRNKGGADSSSSSSSSSPSFSSSSSPSSPPAPSLPVPTPPIPFIKGIACVSDANILASIQQAAKIYLNKKPPTTKVIPVRDSEPALSLSERLTSNNTTKVIHPLLLRR